ncbi:hypothetical protein Anapl_03314 [Anas platyrhynchos]|uniref:Uncharacterized protein n=1 Tax=Anas platyrhynchos TaxID=8839 RepID=R0L305_ANAPL|nr:hypothetical protein Anapl_03314 [Anas platyrhynchos]
MVISNRPQEQPVSSVAAGFPPRAASGGGRAAAGVSSACRASLYVDHEVPGSFIKWYHVEEENGANIPAGTSPFFLVHQAPTARTGATGHRLGSSMRLSGTASASSPQPPKEDSQLFIHTEKAGAYQAFSLPPATRHKSSVVLPSRTEMTEEKHPDCLHTKPQM